MCVCRVDETKRVGVKFLHQASVDQGRGRATARRVILSAAKNLTSSESDSERSEE